MYKSLRAATISAACSTSSFFSFTRWAGLRRRRLRNSCSSSHDRERLSFCLERHSSVPHSTTRSAKYASSSVRSGLSAQSINSAVFMGRTYSHVLAQLQDSASTLGPRQRRFFPLASACATTGRESGVGFGGGNLDGARSVECLSDADAPTGRDH